MNCVKSLFLFGTICCLLAANAKTSDAFQSRWEFAKGDRFDVIVNQKSGLRTKVNQTTVNVDLELGAEMEWSIDSVKPNGNAIIKQQYSRMWVEVAKTAKPTIKYDTAGDQEPEGNAKYFQDVYQKLVGIPFLVEMSNRGEIVNVSLKPEDLETIRSIPESMEVRQLFEKRGLMKIINGGGFLLPEKSVDPGYQWPVTKQQKLSFGTADVSSTITYVGLKESKLAEYKVAGKIELSDQPKNPLEQPLRLKSSKITGQIKFDSEKGHLSSVDYTQEMETEKPFREMTINTVTKSSQKMSIQKK